MDFVHGTRVGRYEIRSLLGSGGMGDVYLARDADLERDVAIKVLRNRDASADRLKRFTQEAKAASALHHPNVAHVYEIGTQDDFRFIAMELVEGETLRMRIARGPLSAGDSIAIAIQAASALAAAHKHGIVHRDIKPENIIIGPDGHVKVLDFGLAKLSESRGPDAETLLKTSPGVAMGTLGYMAPEQIGGDEIGPAADVFSLGVVLFEMLDGRRPFEGSNAQEVVGAILGKSPRPLRNVSARVASIVMRCLEKDPVDRYRDAGALLDDLRDAQRPLRRPPLRLAAAAAIVLLTAAGIWFAVRARQTRFAGQQLALADRLLNQRRLPEAYEATVAAAAILPASDHVRNLLTQTTGRLVVQSDPPGATVYLQRFRGPAERQTAGVTPLTIERLPRADYVVTITKSGYGDAMRPVSLMPQYIHGDAFLRDTPPIKVRLVPSSSAPPGMVLVDGGDYHLLAYDRPSERTVHLQDFFIDRYEVSNRDFEGFVRAGGYRNRKLWKHPFVDNGKLLSFEEAMARFHDATGLAGPRSWSGGVTPEGKANHPVTDITWYEADAYAEWKGKKLPTVFQWERAGRHPLDSAETAFPWGVVAEGDDATERANFQGHGTMPVDSMPFGISPYGAYHMAGNVSEWCRNANPPGFAARGGSWKDTAYVFGQTAALPGFYSAPTLGFRCVSGGGGDEGDFALSPSTAVPTLHPVDDKTFEEIRARYDYKHDPLNARVVERTETPEWTIEKITYSVNGTTVPAYLYLPKGFRRPLQVIQYAAPGDVVGGYVTLPHSIERQLAPLIREGRAVFSVELEGFLGRPHAPGWEQPDRTRDTFAQQTVHDVTELRRGLDYLETRPDIDKSKIAFIGISAGGGPGVYLTALESRYRSVIFAGTGLREREKAYTPAACRINFASRIRAPKMLLMGRYDEDMSLKSEAEPMFRLFTEPKKLEVYEGGHIAPFEVSFPAMTKWLDETVGRVSQ